MKNDIITQQNAVDELYARGKVCLTASKMAKIDSKYRPFLALFADETFLVDERAQTDDVIREIAMEFRIAFPTSHQLKWQYVSASFLKAVYQKAQEFDWYLSQYPIPPNLSLDEVKKLQGFLRRVTNAPCLSVTTITTPEWFRFYSPDKGKFALFANGWLVIAQNSPFSNELPSDISRIYPQISMVETVPEYYVAAIYEQLLYTQPSAREIYIELEKRKIMQSKNISEDEAVMILQSNPKSWKKLLFCDERTARSMIYSHFVENCLAVADEQWQETMKNNLLTSL
ncbi:MAG: hypothetical protein IKO06_00210 [Alphaproteobacteria bacterium]|nr:hypothetical protein [Alphaproteobacteria bacterium]